MSSNAAKFTERKVLHMAACQGAFTINQREASAEEKQQIVTPLVRAKYLKHVSIEYGTASYQITESGKEHLKVLSGCVPKHTPVDNKPFDKLSLEGILSKRLQILRSANNRGLEFNLTDANVRKLLKSEVCYYTGVMFDEDGDPLNARTFERVDDTKGYIQGNVVAVTLRANRIKNALLECEGEMKITVEQFIKMAEQLKKYDFN